jgi:enoyl-CoA hydratase
MTQELLYEIRDGIGFVTLNRPAARNALTFAMYERLAEVAADPGGARALIITGAGVSVFKVDCSDASKWAAVSGLRCF